MSLSVVFQIICLVIVAAAGIAWVLNLYGRIELDPDQKKILNAAFGVSVVGGLAATVGPGFFNPVEPPAASSPFAAASGPVGAGPGAVASTATPSPRASTPANPQESDPVSPSSTPRPTAPEPSLSETVRNFLAANRLERPAIDPQWSASYPRCAEQSRTAQLPKAEARGCFRALDQFNSAVLRPYQDAYDAYVPQVAELSYSQPAGEVLDFLRAEAGGFTNGTHDIAVLYRDISTQLDGDYTRLRGQAY